MSHSYHHEKSGTTFHHNSDMSGSVTINLRDGKSVEIRGSALVGFLASWVRQRKSSAAEHMADHEALGLDEGDMP